MMQSFCIYFGARNLQLWTESAADTPLRTTVFAMFRWVLLYYILSSLSYVNLLSNTPLFIREF
jgi:hypothetical protein